MMSRAAHTHSTHARAPRPRPRPRRTASAVPVLDGAQQAVRCRLLALEVQHGIHQVLQVFGAFFWGGGCFVFGWLV